MKRGTGFLATVFLACTAGAPDLAQAANAFGADVGAITVLGIDSDDRITTYQIGFRSSGTRPGAPVGDVAFSVLPQAFMYGAIVALLDVDVAVPIPVGPNFSIAPRFGASALGAGVPSYGGGVLFGGNVGLGTVMRISDNVSYRVDVTCRQMITNPDVATVPSIVSITTGLKWTISGNRRTDAEPDYPGTGRLLKKRPMKPDEPSEN